MDAYKRYFDYALMCICGIPSIRLMGTVDDWSSIVERVKVLSEWDLQWWTDALLPICEQFVRAAQGEIDGAFWRSIYKPAAAYGGDQATGWITDLFPYTHNRATSRATRKNYLLEMAVENRTPDTGLPIGSFPTSLSQVPIRVELPDGTKTEFDLTAGLVSVGYDSESQSVVPEIGWAVSVASEFDQCVRRLGEAYGWAPREDVLGFEPGPGLRVTVALRTEYIGELNTETFTFETDKMHAKVELDGRQLYGSIVGHYLDGRGTLGIIARHRPEAGPEQLFVLGELVDDDLVNGTVVFDSDEAFLKALIGEANAEF